MCWRTVEAYVRASASSRHARSDDHGPSGSTIATRHLPPSLAYLDAEAVLVRRRHHGARPHPCWTSSLRQPVEMLRAAAPSTDSWSSVKSRLQVGDLLERLFELGAGVLGVTQRIHERHGVVGAERLPSHGHAPPLSITCSDEELPAVALVDALDLHALSFSLTSSSSRSASSNGSTGFTNHASAPDHRASHASCLRSSRITITPVYGRGVVAQRLARARTRRLADAISSATITSGRSRRAARMPSSPLAAARNLSSVPRRALDAAHRERHQLARGGVGRDQQDVHGRDATRSRAPLARPRTVARAVFAWLGGTRSARRRRRARSARTRDGGLGTQERGGTVESTGKAAVAEFVATFALIFIGAGAVILHSERTARPDGRRARARAGARDHGVGDGAHLRRARESGRGHRAVGDGQAADRAGRRADRRRAGRCGRGRVPAEVPAPDGARSTRARAASRRSATASPSARAS